MGASARQCPMTAQWLFFTKSQPNKGLINSAPTPPRPPPHLSPQSVHLLTSLYYLEILVFIIPLTTLASLLDADADLVQARIPPQIALVVVGVAVGAADGVVIRRACRRTLTVRTSIRFNDACRSESAVCCLTRL